MTPTETWILNNILTIMAFVVLGVMAWAKTGDGLQAKKDLEAHKASPTPHPSCPLHDSILSDIKICLLYTSDAADE